MNELFLILFLSIFIYFLIFTTYIIDPFISIIWVFFAVPKKRNKKKNILKKNIVNKTFIMRRLNVKSIHFNEFINNIPKWDEYK